ncbi:MAG TPA: PDZ domain-containing protein [Bryobacteraceae bacterium]
MRSTIGMTLLVAASLLTPAAFAQSRAPRARTIATVSDRLAYLGISTQDVDSERASALKLKEVRGAEITSVKEDSPALKAGFKEGDVIWEYNGQAVEGSAQLTRLVRETPVGRQVKIGIWRNGAAMTLTPTLEASKGMVIDGGTWVMPEVRVPEITIPPMPPIEIPRFEMSYQNPMLGIYGEALGQQEQLAEFFGVKEGVLVKAVTKNSAAEKAGVKAGDVIVKVDEAKVATSRDITSALRASRSKKTITVTVVRNKKEMPLTVTIEASTTTGNVRAGLFMGPITIRPILFNKPLVIGPMVLGPIVIGPAGRALKLPAGNRVI